MKSDASQRIGVLDALTAGLTQTIRRPWLLIIPVIVDLGLWLTPQLSISVLTQRFLVVWETLVQATYSSSQLVVMEEMLRTVQGAVRAIGAQLNLIDVVAGTWLGVPSTIAATQATRVTFVSDVVLAPAGLSLNLRQVAASPWRMTSIEITNVWGALLIVAGLWLVGQLLVALYLRLAAASRPLTQNPAAPGTDPWQGKRGFVRLAIRLTMFSLFLGILIFMLRVPLGLAATFLFLSGSPVAGLLFALVGGITLWLLLWMLTSLFFVSETVLLDHQPVWRGALQSITLVRLNGLSTMGLVLAINLLTLGFRAVWGLIGTTPFGAIVAILGNAYLATGMLLAIFTYYENLRSHWQAVQEKQQVEKQKVDK